MTVKVTKPAINVREELADLRKPSGVAGEAMLRADTPQEQFNLIGAGRRNLIINGAMQVAQRGTSFTSVSPADFTLDRWSYEAGNTSAVLDITQDSDGPVGFTKCLKVDVQTADTSIATNEYAYIQYMVEGTDSAPAGFGASDGKPVTVSFWHKHTAAGTYCISLRNRYSGGTDRSIVGEYYQKASDVWEYSTITFPPCPDGTWTTDSTYAGFRLGFALAMGSIYHATEGVWVSANDMSTDNQINAFASNSNNFRITGVQLELGKVATPFEHRSYGEELALCQRYYQTSSPDITPYRTFANYTATTAYAIWQFPVQMRAVPTVTFASSGWSIYSNAGLRTYTSSTTDGISRTALNQVITGSGWAAGYSSFARCTTANGITMDAEL